ncbi:MAG: HAMP domain-containing protein [Gemmatimonadetes bacterium]|nr:MAG: HAMP domain-containing protein [Gemmatimonadota bacterium]
MIIPRRTRLQRKIITLLIVVLILGFGSYAILSLVSNSEALLTQNRQKAETLSNALKSGIRTVMLSGEGEQAKELIRDIRKNLMYVEKLRIYNKKGDEVYSNEVEPDSTEVWSLAMKQAILDSVQMVLQTGQSMEFTEDTHQGTRFMTRLDPLFNDPQCQKCHEDDHPIRAVIEVSSSLTPIENQIRQNRNYSVIVGLLTIFLSWLVLGFFLNNVVVRPIHHIGDVAERVGRGDLSAHIEIVSDDEIGELAQRMNTMIRELRTKFNLEKFVSQQTISAAASADSGEIKLGGTRERLTVFFSDIRGFTSFTEKTDPEKVVEVLNMYLSYQADIVKAYGGDVDKYVGDELVATFSGSEMVERAIRCAVEIQQRTAEIIMEYQLDLGVGIGINVGEVVVGAMGSPDRMDYTVIGDAVNVGARLCQSAQKHQILLTKTAYNSLQNIAGLNDLEIHLHPFDQLQVKGKTHPLETYQVRYGSQLQPLPVSG